MTIKLNLGVNIEDKEDIIEDMDRLRNMLITGVTGSGKSVMGDQIITSIMKNHTPEEVQFLMVDPKGNELGKYAGSPYLPFDPIIDIDESIDMLESTVSEMNRRFDLFCDANAKYDLNITNLSDYNKKVSEGVIEGETLANMIIYVDELFPIVAMDKDKDRVELAIQKISAKGRTCGTRMILATQSPHRDIVTGIIKSNTPTKVSLMVSNKKESLIAIGREGAEQLRPHGHFIMATTSSEIQGVSPYIDPDEAKAIAMQKDDELKDKQLENRIRIKINEVVNAIFDEERAIEENDKSEIMQRAMDEKIEKARFDKGLKQ